MAWVYDAPNNVYKNHALSTKIRRQAIADAVMARFATPEPGYGKHKGESVTITRYRNLPLATRITETDPLPAGRPAVESKSVSVSQWGFRIPVTEFEKDLTFYDIMNPLQAILRDQITLTVDKMVADAFKLGPIKYVPMAAGPDIDTDGTPSSTADKNLDVDDLRVIHDYLNATLKCPKFRNGKYMGVLSTRAARGIKNDPEYKDWQAPTTSAPFITGMLKDCENFTLVETNHFDALADLVGASTVCGEALFFGADAVGLVEVMAPELRLGLKTRLGTEQDIGWVGTVEAFHTWEAADLARVIHVTST